MTSSDVDRYLARIAYAGPREPTLTVLGDVHVAHLRAVPFENLSVRRRETIVLEESALLDKIPGWEE